MPKGVLIDWTAAYKTDLGFYHHRYQFLFIQKTTIFEKYREGAIMGG